MLRALAAAMCAAVAVMFLVGSVKHPTAHKFTTFDLRTDSHCPASAKAFCERVFEGQGSTPTVLVAPQFSFFYMVKASDAQHNSHCRGYQGGAAALLQFDGAPVVYHPELIADGKWHLFHLALRTQQLSAGRHRIRLVELGKNTVSLYGEHCANITAPSTVRVAVVGFSGGLTSGRGLSDEVERLQKGESH